MQDYDIQWTERDLLLQANTEHKRLNGELRVENKILREAVEELYDVMSNIDFAAQGLFKYDDMPWKKWEAVVNKEPIQLRLF